MKASSGLQLEVPKLAPQLVANAYGLVAAGDESTFAGALLWLRRWEIWSPQIDEVGVQLFGNALAAAGSTGLPATPACQFGAAEFDQAYSLFSLPLLLQWDVYLVPPSAEYFIYVTHNATCFVIGRESLGDIPEAFIEWERVGDARLYPDI